jgi:hypothetical protein
VLYNVFYRMVLTFIVLACPLVGHPALAQDSLNGATLQVHVLTAEEIEQSKNEERLARVTLMRDKQKLLSLVQITPDMVQNYANFAGGWGSGETFFYRVEAILKNGGRCDLGIGINRPSQMLESRSVTCKDPSGNPIAEKSIRLLPRNYSQFQNTLNQLSKLRFNTDLQGEFIKLLTPEERAAFLRRISDK